VLRAGGAWTSRTGHGLSIADSGVSIATHPFRCMYYSIRTSLLAARPSGRYQNPPRWLHWLPGAHSFLFLLFHFLLTSMSTIHIDGRSKKICPPRHLPPHTNHHHSDHKDHVELQKFTIKEVHPPPVKETQMLIRLVLNSYQATLWQAGRHFALRVLQLRSGFNHLVQ
jgi:hypothetical protein